MTILTTVDVQRIPASRPVEVRIMTDREMYVPHLTPDEIKVLLTAIDMGGWVTFEVIDSRERRRNTVHLPSRRIESLKVVGALI